MPTTSSARATSIAARSAPRARTATASSRQPDGNAATSPAPRSTTGHIGSTGIRATSEAAARRGASNSRRRSSTAGTGSALGINAPLPATGIDQRHQHLGRRRPAARQRRHPRPQPATAASPVDQRLGRRPHAATNSPGIERPRQQIYMATPRVTSTSVTTTGDDSGGIYVARPAQRHRHLGQRSRPTATIRRASSRVQDSIGAPTPATAGQHAIVRGRAATARPAVIGVGPGVVISSTDMTTTGDQQPRHHRHLGRRLRPDHQRHRQTGGAYSDGIIADALPTSRSTAARSPRPASAAPASSPTRKPAMSPSPAARSAPRATIPRASMRAPSAMSTSPAPR